MSSVPKPTEGAAPAAQQASQVRPTKDEEEKRADDASIRSLAGSEASDVAMRDTEELRKMEQVARASGQPVAATAMNLGDLRRVWEKHNESVTTTNKSHIPLITTGIVYSPSGTTGMICAVNG